MEKTMVQLQKSTVEKLQSLKRYKRETYDDLINFLIEDNSAEPLSDQEISEIEQGIKDIKAGRLYSLQSIAKEFNVKL